MKKLLLKSMLLLCALIVGSSSVWGQTTATYVFTNSSWGATLNSETANWTGSATADGFDNTKGVQIYKANNGINATSPISYNNISSIVVTWSTSSNGTGSIQIKIGNSDYETIGTVSTSKTNNTFTKNYTTAQSGSVNLKVTCTKSTIFIKSIAITYAPAPSYTITPAVNDEDMGTVSLTGTTITASPKSGYRVKAGADGYTVTSGTATVTNHGDNTFTVTPTSACTVQINFEAIPTYTVTFNAEGGSCGTSSLTETVGGGGITLPTATINETGWEFAGWATSSQIETSTRPTLYKAGTTYKPTANITLHAVYTLNHYDPTKFVRVTNADDLAWAKAVVIVNNNNSYVLNHSRETEVSAPTETSGKISPAANTIFTLGGNNTEGYTFTGANGTLGVANSLPSSGSKATSWTESNNKWIVEEHDDGSTYFALRNAGGTYVALQYSSGWKAYYVQSYYKNTTTSMKLYVPETLYNSNPSALTVPEVSFEKGGTTLYLDGTTSYTNTASVTGVSKTVNYSSSNTSVATVNASGVVTAVGIGTATITASVAAELGVSVSASDTYTVVVKSTTTISGIKALSNTATEVEFTADLTDAVVTYVSSNYAYIQDASAAIMINYEDHGLAAGKRINGFVSGTVKAPNTVDQIIALDLSKATVTDDGVIPTAVDDKTLAQIKTAGAAYDGMLINISGATVANSITTTQNTGSPACSIKDGSQIELTDVSFIIYAPNKGIEVNDQEKGDFTGFVSIYNGAYRLNLYEQSQFTKTHNAPTDQPMSFTIASYDLSEDTPAYTEFAGQTVTGNVGTVTYSIEDGNNADGIVTSINSTTGAVVLSGAYGTAIITATAAATELTEAGVTTPYNETVKTYTVSVGPRYSVTFHVNGVTSILRETSHDAGVAVPTPAATLGDYTFRGWNTSAVSPTDTKPAGLTDLDATIYPDDNDDVYYAVYAKETVGDDENVYIYTNSGSTGTDATSGITASGNINANNGAPSGGNCFGMTSSSNKTVTFTNINIASTKSAKLNFKYKLAKSGSSYSSLTVTQYDSQNTVLGSATEITGSDQNYHTTSDIALNKNCVKITIVCTPAGSTYNTYVDDVVINVTRATLSYNDYRTSLPTVEVSIGTSGMLAFCYDRALDFSTTDVKAYKAKVEGGQVKLTKISDGIVPANTGIVLAADENSYEIPVATSDPSISFSDNEMVGLLVRTQVFWNPSTDVYNYILQGGEFKKASTGFLKANRAYLSTSYNVTAAGARDYMEIVFEDEPTAIRGIENGELRMENSFYDLQGRKVAQPTKGLYIVNGKKVNVK